MEEGIMFLEGSEIHEYDENLIIEKNQPPKIFFCYLLIIPTILHSNLDHGEMIPVLVNSDDHLF